VGYWVTEDGSDNSFTFLLAHESREEAKKNWDAMRVDPESQEIVKSEQAEKTLESIYASDGFFTDEIVTRDLIVHGIVVQTVREGMLTLRSLGDCDHSTMEGAGQCSRGIAVVARHAPEGDKEYLHRSDSPTMVQ